MNILLQPASVQKNISRLSSSGSSGLSMSSVISSESPVAMVFSSLAGSASILIVGSVRPGLKQHKLRTRIFVTTCSHLSACRHRLMNDDKSHLFYVFLSYPECIAPIVILIVVDYREEWLYICVCIK